MNILVLHPPRYIIMTKIKFYLFRIRKKPHIPVYAKVNAKIYIYISTKVT